MVMVAPSKVLWWLTRASGHPHWGPVRPLHRTACSQHPQTHITRGKISKKKHGTWPESRRRADLRLTILSLGAWTQWLASSPPQWAHGLLVSSCPGQCGSVGWALSHAPKACQFDSQSGPMPGFQARSWIPALPFVAVWHWASYSTSLGLSFFTTSEILWCAIVKAQIILPVTALLTKPECSIFKRLKPKINSNFCIISLSYSMFFPWRDFWY